MERLHHVISMAVMVVTMMQISNNNNLVGVIGCIDGKIHLRESRYRCSLAGTERVAIMFNKAIEDRPGTSCNRFRVSWMSGGSI
jgi:hypothetical protein